jgi:exonuclease VII small subunit
MDRRERFRELIAQLEQQSARLEQVKLRAQMQGGAKGERLEAQAQARLRDIEERINDLRASLGKQLATKKAAARRIGRTPRGKRMPPLDIGRDGVLKGPEYRWRSSLSILRV